MWIVGELVQDTCLANYSHIAIIASSLDTFETNTVANGSVSLIDKLVLLDANQHHHHGEAVRSPVELLVLVSLFKWPWFQSRRRYTFGFTPRKGADRGYQRDPGTFKKCFFCRLAG